MSLLVSFLIFVTTFSVEYLVTVFPNHDLSEQGKDWADCLSAIDAMTETLYAETEVPAVSFLLSYYRTCCFHIGLNFRIHSIALKMFRPCAV